MLEEVITKNNELLAEVLTVLKDINNSLKVFQISTTTKPQPQLKPGQVEFVPVSQQELVLVQAPAPEPQPQQEPEPVQAPTPVSECAPPKDFTLDEIRAHCVTAGTKGRTDVVVNFLARKGVQKLTQLDPSFYNELYTTLQQEGVI
jgi:hypothetical protein